MIFHVITINILLLLLFSLCKKTWVFQVLGGKAKRKKLLSPKGMDVRPMMEVVKGSAFDILQVLILLLFVYVNLGNHFNYLSIGSGFYRQLVAVLPL